MSRTTPLHSAAARALILLLAWAPASLLAQYVGTDIERHDIQTGYTATTLQDVGVWHSAAVADSVGVTGSTVTVNSGTAQTMTYDANDKEWTAYQSYSTVAAAVAANPTDATYTYNLSTTSGAKTVAFTGPGGNFDNVAPTPLQFTFSNPSVGSFESSGGWNRLEINPNAVSNFSLTYTAFSAANAGAFAAHWLNVDKWTNDGGNTSVVQYDSPLTAATTKAVQTFTINFDKTATGTTFDAASSTYTLGFSSNSGMYIEAGYSNVFGTADSGLGDGSIPVACFGSTIALQLNFSTTAFNGLVADASNSYVVNDGLDHALTTVNGLTDAGATAQRLSITGANTTVRMESANDYSGGTSISTGAQVVVVGSGALGSGAVTVTNAGLTLYNYSNTPTTVNIANAINIRATTGGFASLSVGHNSNLSGNVTIAYVAGNNGATNFWLSGGTYSGTLTANGAYIGLSEGTFAGTLVASTTQGNFVRIGDVNASNPLMISGNLTLGISTSDTLDLASQATMSGALTLTSSTRVSYSGGEIDFVDGGSATLAGAQFYFNGTIQSGWAAAFAGGLAQLDYKIFGKDVSSSINGSLTEYYQTGYNVAFETRSDGLYAVVTQAGLSSVPEPSTYAAIAGALVLGMAAYRRRRA